MRILGMALCVSMAFAAGAMADDSGAHEWVELWPGGAPGAKGDAITDRPAVSVHRAPDATATGTAVIVCPGGGMQFLSSDTEGLQVARYLNSIGVTAFVLRYRVRPDYDEPDAQLDGMRAVRYVRHHAKFFGVDPERIGVLGFSAGGHLASQLGTTFDDGSDEAADPVERASSRPDFMVLVYAVTSGEMLKRFGIETDSTYTRVTEESPPTFLVQSSEDMLVWPDHAILFYQALREAKVPAELHIFGYGNHGMGMGAGDPEFGAWPPLLHRWMRRTALLTGNERIPVRGTLTIDGEPASSAWVTFHPEDPAAPTGVAQVSTLTNGRIVIDAAHGPAAGPHRVEVTVTSLFPFPPPKTGAYSLDDAMVYTHASPDASEPLSVDLEPGVPVELVLQTK